MLTVGRYLEDHGDLPLVGSLIAADDFLSSLPGGGDHDPPAGPSLGHGLQPADSVLLQVY